MHPRPNQESNPWPFRLQIRPMPLVSTTLSSSGTHCRHHSNTHARVCIHGNGFTSINDVSTCGHYVHAVRQQSHVSLFLHHLHHIVHGHQLAQCPGAGMNWIYRRLVGCKVEESNKLKKTLRIFTGCIRRCAGVLASEG